MCSLPNTKDSGTERHILSRDLDHIVEFVQKHDVPGRGVFFCVSTIDGHRRNKETAAEKLFWHVDVDYEKLGLPAPEALDALKRLEPLLIVLSGHGYHGYWPHEARPWTDSDEGTLRVLAGKVRGDEMVCQRVALMRMPGTHNTKRAGESVEVRVVYTNGSARQDDPHGWPVVLEGGEKLNVWEVFGSQFGYKPPLDVEQILGEMSPGNIHETQLRVTASMVSRGVDSEEILKTVMARTQEVAGEDSGWNWDKEEAAVRKMIEDAEAKGFQRSKSNNGNVVNLGQKRQEKQQQKEQERKEKQKEAAQERATKKSLHIMVARGFLEKVLPERGEAILFEKEVLWRYRNGTWKAFPQPEEANGWINAELQDVCNNLRIVPKSLIINEARAWIKRNSELRKEDVPWDGHGKILTRGGAFTDGTKSVPGDYATRSVTCSYDPAAQCPLWLQFLGDCFRSNPEMVLLIQEVAGMMLIEKKSRALRRGLFFSGDSNCGKSTIISALAGIFSETWITTGFEDLSGHGTSSFVNADPWVLHEAFRQGKWHDSDIAKTILAGDATSVNIKNGPHLTIKPRNPVLWGANYDPQFREASRAFENRLVLISCKRTFDPSKPTGVDVIAQGEGYSGHLDRFLVDREGPGILNWLITGCLGAQARGFFLLPDEVQQNLRQMRLESNPVEAFLEDCVIPMIGGSVCGPDFYGSFCSWWWEANGNDRNPPSPKSVTTMGKVLAGRKGLKFSVARGGHRYVEGCHLNETGLSFWEGYSGSPVAQQRGSRLSDSSGLVNRSIKDEIKAANEKNR